MNGVRIRIMLFYGKYRKNKWIYRTAVCLACIYAIHIVFFITFPIVMKKNPSPLGPLRRRFLSKRIFFKIRFFDKSKKTKGFTLNCIFLILLIQTNQQLPINYFKKI